MPLTKPKLPEDLIAKSGIFKGMNTFMAVGSMVMILAFVLYTIWDVEVSSEVFSAGKDFIIGSLDWFYVLVVNAALFFSVWLLFSRFGHVKLGKEEDEPDFSTFSWIAMLFSAGLGSGLIYWGVAEPMFHIQGNPFAEGAGIAADLFSSFLDPVFVQIVHDDPGTQLGRQLRHAAANTLPGTGDYNYLIFQ